MVPGVPFLDRGNWDESVTARVIMCSLFVNNIIYRVLCFVKTVLQIFVSYTLIPDTNADAVRGRPY